ncbi:hypothetical protein [uncultured Tenacibaculum sp.]|uniref:hypothetical protein n=1 Tax=uncultured Tenacibaculum sp. TaxID=174713 RepID=UPI00261A5394|nr:hypothetical protein [uncultured Tenacibaculum sp.]
MKIKIYSVLCFSFIALTISAQKKNITTTEKNKPLVIIAPEGKLKSNQLVLNFLKSDSRFNSLRLKKLINNQNNVGYNDYEDINIKIKEIPGQAVPVRTFVKIYLDNELILDSGFNRLHVLNDLRMKKVKKISRKNVSSGKEIYIYTL